jgi:hypothetical protein
MALGAHRVSRRLTPDAAATCRDRCDRASVVCGFEFRFRRNFQQGQASQNVKKMPLIIKFWCRCPLLGFAIGKRWSSKGGRFPRKHHPHRAGRHARVLSLKGGTKDCALSHFQSPFY